jgi:WD40 repeat protein
MGGLVIKRVYITAKQRAEFSSVAQRIKAIVFLATPHRGSDLAQLFSKFLNASPGHRPFVMDLHRNSHATQLINDEFPQYCQDLQLFSFYETTATNIGVGKSLIVHKDLAILGYSNERTAYLTADHRGVCKYATKKDPNYLTVRNTLASIIDGFRAYTTSPITVPDNEEQKLLDAFLGTCAAVEDDFMDVDNLRMSGSCEWLMGKSSFQEWLESANTQFYWINAKPATGKTVLSGKVVRHLTDLNRDCQFYFFEYGNKAKSTITSFLLSMARQMALLHPEILRVVFELRKKEDQLRKEDYRTIWRILYVDSILKVKLVRPQFWVIDALDECQAGSELIPLLLKVLKELPVRIFLTSRDPSEAHRQHIPPGTKILSEEISRSDTQSDIELYLESPMSHLHSADDEDRQTIKAQILGKADGCFLWVKLVLEELHRVHTSAEIRQVLGDVPSDMDALYSRVLNFMSQTLPPKGKDLARAILTWTVCAARALTTNELKAALQLHIGDTVHGIKSAITSKCGQLVHVDSHEQVHVVHQTVRGFLFRAKSSEFAIDKHLGHRQLAMTCLQYLGGQDMIGPTRRRLSVSTAHQQRSDFASYACNSFFEHLNHVSPADDEQQKPTYDDVANALADFLNSPNVLSWIEYIAQHSDLKRLIQTGRAIKHFLQKRLKHMSPYSNELTLMDSCANDIIRSKRMSNFSTEVAIMESWATDLIRLVTKFGKNLLASPSSINHLIPPFCPPESAPRKLFATSGRGISLVGLSDSTWGDCLSTIIDPSEQFTALACCSIQFAIGMVSGTIRVYNPTTCQEIKTLHHIHKEPVKHLRYGMGAGVLVSSGTKMIRVWNTATWEQMYEFKISSQCMSIALADEDQFLLAALKNNCLMLWDLDDGTLCNSNIWTRDLEGQRVHSFRRPIAAAFSVEECLLAVVYRGQDILLYDLEADALFETYTKETGARASSNRTLHGGVVSVVFGAELTRKLLAAAYVDGDLVIFDTSEGMVKEMTLANAQILAASPDGRTLAAGDSSGTIQFYDFETLRLLYRLKSDEYSITRMKFTADSHHLIDIRGSQCQAWDPMVLVRQDADEELSDTISISPTMQEMKLESFEDHVLVTSLACHGSSEIFFCGKEDGAVYLYEMKHGQHIKKLFSHAEGVAIVSLCFDDERKFLSSVDSSSRVMIRRVFRQQEAWEVEEPIFDYRAGVAVDQILFNRGQTRILVGSSMAASTIWEISPDGNKIIDTISWDGPGSCRWAGHPLYPDQLIQIADRVAHLYDWQTLRRLTLPEGILLEGSIKPELAIRSITPCFNGNGIATAFGESLKRHCRSKLLLWNASDFTPESKRAAVIPRYKNLADEIDFLIGVDGQRLVFLHSDNWICSTDPQYPDDIIRHFFLPSDWLTTNNDLMIEIAPNRDILFVKRDEVAVIKRGLDNEELSTDSQIVRRPSPFGRRRNSNGTAVAMDGRETYRSQRRFSDKNLPIIVQTTAIYFEEEVNGSQSP